jgi:DNA mismatch repair protein MutS
VCRTTEISAGISLVASTIIKLDEKKSTFIFATHMHEIMKINKIKDLKHVKPYHIEVKCDEKTNTLVFNRDLKEGSGTDTYGLIVANHILKDKSFIDLAYEIKNEITGTDENMISGKFSRYNKNVLVNACSLCGYTPKHGEVPLETHHINFQQDCDEDGLVKNKKHIKKNQESNLVPLCETCHLSLHQDKKIILDKYVLTSEGKKISMKKE